MWGLTIESDFDHSLHFAPMELLILDLRCYYRHFAPMELLNLGI